MNGKAMRLLAISAALGTGLVGGCGGSDNHGVTFAPLQGIAPSDGAPPAQSGPPAVSILSSRTDMVSGGSALVQVTVPADADVTALKVAVNQVAQPAVLSKVGDRTAIGLITGLSMGENIIDVSAGGQSGSVKIQNHDINGPIFSGPHQKPWVCQTASFKLPDGTTLGDPVDENCNAPTKVLYLYLPKGQTTWKVLPSALPADVQATTTSDGRTANLIVRHETGTLNRGIYQTAVLFDPTIEGTPAPVKSYAGWNKKAVFVFGGSTGAGYIQGTSTGLSPVSGVLETAILSRGFAVLGSTLDVFGTNANDVLGAETAAMVKERFIKTYGVPMYLMGWGLSGGSILQRGIANNYPGILDGIAPGESFSDLVSVMPSAMDCPLLDRAFTNSSSLAWSDAQKTAVSGYGTWKACTNAWQASYAPGLVVAKRTAYPPIVYGGNTYELNNCSLAIPASALYDPVTNPAGARCTVYETQKNMLGIDPANGFAYRPLDNEGVQYGLGAFQAGDITAEQFVQLNEFVGGYDQDGNLQSARMTAPAAALNAAFANGRVNQMENLSDIPILDWRNYTDLAGDVHDSVRSLVSRARLERGGSAGNQVIYRGPAITQPLMNEVLTRMDQWLTSIKSDAGSYPSQAAKVLANKPPGLVDTCFDSTGTPIAEHADISNSGTCGALYPFHRNPRLVAGAPLTDDVLKCQLKPIQRSDYPASLSDAQLVRLSAVFPAGVCDYQKPSIGFTPLGGTWLSYADGRGSAIK